MYDKAVGKLKILGLTNFCSAAFVLTEAGYWPGESCPFFNLHRRHSSHQQQSSSSSSSWEKKITQERHTQPYCDVPSCRQLAAAPIGRYKYSTLAGRVESTNPAGKNRSRLVLKSVKMPETESG